MSKRTSAIALLTVVPLGCSAAGGEVAVPSSDAQPAPTPQGGELIGSPEVLDLSPWPGDEFWMQVAPGGLAIYVFGGLTEMTEAAHLVVVGRATSVKNGRPVPGDAAADGVGRGLITFAVDDVIAGSPVYVRDQELNLEFTLADARLLPRYTAKVPDERVLLFLGNWAALAKAHGFDPAGPWGGEDMYGIIGPQAYFREANGQVEPPTGTHDDWVVALGGMTFDALVAQVRAVSDELEEPTP